MSLRWKRTKNAIVPVSFSICSIARRILSTCDITSLHLSEVGTNVEWIIKRLRPALSAANVDMFATILLLSSNNLVSCFILQIYLLFVVFVANKPQKLRCYKFFRKITGIKINWQYLKMGIINNSQFIIGGDGAIFILMIHIQANEDC